MTASDEALARALAALEAERRAHEDELALARRLQRALLPRLPRADRFACAVLDRPAAVVGGDTWDVHLTVDGRLRVFVADTTGHGVEAALRTMIVRTVLDRHRALRGGPDELLARINDDVVAAFPGLDLRFAAACFELDLEADPDGAACLDYADAALCPLLVLRQGAPLEHSLGGPFVGLVPGVRFPRETLRVLPGDRLVLASDGLYEHFDVQGARVPEALVHAALAGGSDPEAAVAALTAALDAFRGDRAPDDDVAVFVVEYRGGDASWITRW